MKKTITKKTYPKNYVESASSIKWMAKNVPKMGDSAFIRGAVRREIERIKAEKSTGKKVA
jgi:hypothetical protein